MAVLGVTAAPRDESALRSPSDRGMIRLPGGTFRMGSNRHYPEEAPVHRVTVDAFWIDRTPVTNRDFRKFVNATNYVTFAEIPPDPKDYPGALPLSRRRHSGPAPFSPLGSSRAARPPSVYRTRIDQHRDEARMAAILPPRLGILRLAEARQGCFNLQHLA
jgi:formylglycine-generating enzyme required for sulfatase activity